MQTTATRTAGTAAGVRPTASRPRRFSRTLWSAAVLLTEESRRPVLVIFTGRFLTSAVLAAPLPRAAGPVLLGALAWALATMAVYVFNGVADRVEDRANGSSRPVASGRLSVPAAVRGTACCTALSVLLALTAQGGLPLVCLLGFLVAGYAYSGPPVYGKRHTVGAALLVLVLGAATYAGGWLTADRCIALRPHAHALVIVFGTALTLWMAMVGVLVKDLSDVEGDAVVGRRTPVLVWGQTVTRTVIFVNSLAVSGGFLLAALRWAPALVPGAAALLAGALAVMLTVVTTRHSPDRGRQRRPYRMFMIAQYAAHVLVLGTFLTA